jgi:hypothetical protein
VDLKKDGTTVGSIGAYDGRPYLASTTVGIRVSNALFPSDTSGVITDGAMNIGGGAGRFKDLYLSGGVYLGGTGSANKLDDYETGTWTPVYAPSGGSFASITMDTPDCFYVKVGNKVSVSALIRTDAVDITGGSGNLLIGGLPFPANGWGAISIGRIQGFAGETPLSGYVGGSSTNINLYHRTSVDGDTTATSISDLTTGTNANSNYMFMQCTYYTNS